MTIGHTSVVRRKRGIPGYNPEADRIVTELAEKGVVVPTRRQTGATSPRRSASAARDTEAGEDQDAYVVETEDEDYEEKPRRRRRTEIQPAPRRRQPQHHRVHWLLPLGMGMLTLLMLYVLVYLGDLGLVKLTNILTYGPNHVSIYKGVVGEHDSPAHPTIFIATLLHGSIMVEELPAGDQTQAKVFTFPQLMTAAWGDVQDIVVTVSPQTTGPTPNMLVKVVGDPEFGTFLARPTVTFLLLHTSKGYKYGGVLQQSS